MYDIFISIHYTIEICSFLGWSQSVEFWMQDSPFDCIESAVSSCSVNEYKQLLDTVKKFGWNGHHSCSGIYSEHTNAHM